MGAHKLHTLETSNHLGNVLTLFTDKKVPVGTGATVSYYKADLVSSMDYSPFGAPLKGRTFNGSGSRYGFNGKENDNEVKGSGNQQDYGFRIYDNRLGRFLSVDPLTQEYPFWTPYQFTGNNPVMFIDPDGQEVMMPLLGTSNTPMIEILTRVNVENLVKVSTEIGSKTSEIAVKTSEMAAKTSEGEVRAPKFSPEQLANFKRGHVTEAEQLAKNGYQKNTKPLTENINGKDVKTIPDAMKNGGKSTSEIKNVKKQSLTEQLKAQEKFSNKNGYKPELIINKGAELSKPLQNSSFEFKFYNVVPADNTRTQPPTMPVQQQKTLPAGTLIAQYGKYAFIPYS